MLITRLTMTLGLCLSLVACGAVEPPSRNASGEPLAAISPAIAPLPVPSVSVTDVQVVVPRSLRVTEANLFLPSGDIVWREDPAGDRYQQVQTIVQSAMERGVAGMNGPVEAILQVQLVRFHALTEKARKFTGGVHSIAFDMRLVDPATGTPLSDVRRVEADLEAYGGKAAITAMARGETQKRRITDHLAQVIQQVLVDPNSYRNARLGLLQTLNKM
ncbi:DUF6778 family protein [Tritonibacter scottomollicae]|uniref:DUF6778 family protein n=1 Tax=Tritonibacter scottomollicae TaxID=483013 RepID=UPI003AA8E0F9